MRLTQTEQQAQRAVGQYLDLCGVLWCHVPNGGKRTATEAKIFRGLGVKAGVPDLLVFTPPPAYWSVGLAIELKREQGGRVTEEQHRWHKALRSCGWLVLVCHGSGDAIDRLHELGYCPGMPAE